MNWDVNGKPETRWWAMDENKIHQLSNSFEHGLQEIYAREVDGVWEYAIVWWFHCSPELQLLIRDGKIVEKESVQGENDGT